ncbi:hypothetical protein ABT297_15870 [Dactylosporangium sp. NPDC000555]|uniref:hypothetical protein n=1 Tax=Dactylosporangium sp. NPDC000555 TaxID=3154260 RepID=UPI00331D6E2A
MTGLDRVVTEALARVADDDVHVERLLAAARAGGIRHRRRRRVAIVAGTAFSVAVAGTAIALTAALLPTTADGMPAAPPATIAAPSPAPSAKSTTAAAPPKMTAPPLLPPADGPPSALSDPAQVGRPWLVHLGMDALPFPASVVQYHTSADGEWVMIQGGSMLTVRLSRGTTDFEPLTGAQRSVVVNGRSGTFAHDSRSGDGTLRWRLANGLWLQVYGQLDEAAALAVANSVRVDRTYRCAVPFRLPSVPAGTKADSCGMTFFGGPSRSTATTIAIGASYVKFTTERGDGPATAAANETLGGRPARVLEHPGDGGRPILEIQIGMGGGTTLSMVAEGSYKGSAVRELAATLQWLGGDDPAAWPDNPLPNP